MVVTSPRLRLGRSKVVQLAPESRLSYNREFMAPASKVLGFKGSIATVVAVPPNGPASFQSSIGVLTAQAAIPAAASAIAGKARVLIIVGYFCFNSLYCYLSCYDLCRNFIAC